MAKEFRFPDLGEGISEGELVRWLVKEGDSVKEDQEIAEVETDKALVTIPSPFSGKIEKLYFKTGEQIPVGKTFISFSEGSEAAPDKSKKETEEVPESKEEKKPAEKADEEPTEKSVKKESTKESPTQPQESEKKSEASPSTPLATPYTRRIARELGVDLAQVSGSGPQGRITEEDIRKHASAPKKEEKKEGEKPSPPPSIETKGTAEDFEKFGEVERVPLKGIRRKISEHLLTAAHQTVMVTHMDEAEVDQLLQLKREKQKYAEERKVKLTLLPFLMKACVIALKEYPYLNSSLVGEEIVLKKYYNFGFAVDTDVGLLVPVIQNVDQKSIIRLASELKTLSDKARDRSVSVEELKGHTFSLTNIGSIGGKYFTPIIHYPDSAILGLGRTQEKPVVRDDQIKIASTLPLCLTFDHRVTDGATAARFVNEVIRYLKDPDLLLLDDGES